MQTTFEIKVVEGPGRGRRMPVTSSGLTVGRSSSCDLPLEDTEVSKRHCTFAVKDGAIRLHDEDSTNGTFVNGRRQKDCALSDGDRVAVGSAVIKVICREPSPKVTVREVLPWLLAAAAVVLAVWFIVFTA